MPIDGMPGGDFTGCVRAMRGKMDSPEAFCAWKQHELTGKWPAEEALQTVAAQESSKEIELHETAPAFLTVREAETPNVVFLDGVLIKGGLSFNRNFYTDEALESAAGVFANKPIRVNHPKRSEDRDRPEGDVWTQVGRLPDISGFSIVTLSDGIKEVRFKGAILSYSPVDAWIGDRIRAGIIGDMSINAGGEGTREADGSFRVSRFTAATSHDLVTTAAAGGRAELQESHAGGDMTPQEIAAMVEAQVKKALGEVNLVDHVMEANGLPREMRPLLEAEARRLKEEGEMTPPEPKPEMTEQEPAPEFLGDLPDALKAQWGDSFTACMAGENPDEMACANGAWLTVCQALLPAPAPEMEGEACAPKEALNAYAQKLKASMAKAPGVGNVQGMGGGSAPTRTPATDQRPYNERVKEAFSRIPGFTETMAATAAGGRD